MQKSNSSAGRELVRTVISGHLSEVVFDVAEAALDANLTDGVIKDLPIIGPVMRLVQAGKSISSALFILKLMRFLKELQSVPWEEREKLLKKYPDSSERQKVGYIRISQPLNMLNIKPVIRFIRISNARNSVNFCTIFPCAKDSS